MESYKRFDLGGVVMYSPKFVSPLRQRRMERRDKVVGFLSLAAIVLAVVLFAH